MPQGSLKLQAQISSIDIAASFGVPTNFETAPSTPRRIAPMPTMPAIPKGPEIDFAARDAERQRADEQVSLARGIDRQGSNQPKP